MYYSALLGKPVEHSISPQLFRVLGESLGVEYSHLKIEVATRDLLREYFSALKILNFCGINITLPYKLYAMNFVDELDETASNCGAVNTIVFKGNKIIGYNTDAIGAIRAIEIKLRKIKSEDEVCIIGSGGASRAVVYEVYKRCKNISIINIDQDEAKKLSNDLSNGKIKYYKLNDVNLIFLLGKSNFIINATSVGMSPESEKTIISRSVLDKFRTLEGKYFFDAIFNPYKTKFLLDAEKRGAKVCSGLYWMIFQASAAIKLWLDLKEDIKIDEDKVALKLLKHLSR